MPHGCVQARIVGLRSPDAYTMMITEESRMDLIERLYECIMDARREDAKALLVEAIADLGYETALGTVLSPTLHLIGERWATDRISLAQGFVAGKVAEDFFTLGADYWSTLSSGNSGSRQSGRITVVGNVEDDYHALGRSMVVSFLRLRGWEVRDLGCDVLARDFVDQAVSEGACVIGASAMMLTTARNISSIRKELNDRDLQGRIKLAVGGAVFNMRPELVAEVGGDGTATSALLVPELFERLRNQLADPITMPGRGERAPR